MAKSPSEMTPGQINKRLDALDKQSSKLTDKFIAAGRGNERFSDIRQQTDPLSLAYIKINDEQQELHREIGRRYGPGAPARLPPGTGRKRKVNPMKKRKPNPDRIAPDIIRAKLPAKFRAKKFSDAIVWFTHAVNTKAQYNDLVNKSLAKYGDHGPLISGVIRDHFPEETKNVLRRVNHDYNEFDDKGFAARPPRVQISTMRQLREAVKKARNDTVKVNPMKSRKPNPDNEVRELEIQRENNPARKKNPGGYDNHGLPNVTNYAEKAAVFVNVITRADKSQLEGMRAWLRGNTSNMAKSPTERRIIKSLLTIVNRELKGYAKVRGRNPVRKKTANRKKLYQIVSWSDSENSLVWLTTTSPGAGFVKDRKNASVYNSAVHDMHATAERYGARAVVSVDTPVSEIKAKLMGKR